MINQTRPRVAAIALAGLLGLAGVGGCKQQDQAPQLPAHEALLAGTIQLLGGAKKLEKASSFSARYQAAMGGVTLNGTLKQRAGARRLEYVDKLSGNPVVQVTTDKQCWQKVGRVVLPCHKALAAHSAKMTRALAATWLFGLSKDHKLEAAKVELGGKTYDGLKVGDSAGGAIASLAIDGKSSLVVGIKLATELGGKQGELVGVFSEPEDHCGLKLPTKQVYTFAGAPYMTVKITGAFCEAIDDKTFARPEQVKHGLTEIRHTYDTPLACTKLKGELSGLRGAMDKLVAHLAANKLQPLGAAALVHRKGPPKLKKASAWVTDVCFPVSKKAWVMPKSEWKGDFFLDQIAGDEVLAGFGVGAVEKLTVELPALLLAEAKKQGRKQAGTLIQRVYARPGDLPAEQSVSEMYLPLD